MPFKKHERQYDLIVFGATGYTGQLTAEYITTHLPTDLNWAIAGRSEAKLQTLVEECRKLNPNRLAPAVEIANVDDDSQLSSLAKKTFLLITTVGAYYLHGEHALKACAEAGTHYLDVTGEAVWVNHMIKKYEKTAQASGAIMIPQIGIESSPADLCTWAMARCLRQQLGAYAKDVTLSFHKFNAVPSGGTMSTVFGMFDHYPLKELVAASKPYAASPIPHQEPARARIPPLQKIFGIHSVPNLGLLTTSLAGKTDSSVVERTWGLLPQIPSRKEQFYGPRFTWAEYLKPRNWFHGIILHWGLALFGAALAFLPPFRKLARGYFFQAGDGPDKHNSERDEIELRGVAEPDTESPTGKQVFCRARFFGSMYYLTGVFLGSAAWTMLEDDTGLDGGMYTPACLGQAFIDRLDDGGFKMEVKVIEK